MEFWGFTVSQQGLCSTYIHNDLTAVLNYPTAMLQIV